MRCINSLLTFWHMTLIAQSMDGVSGEKAGGWSKKGAGNLAATSQPRWRGRSWWVSFMLLAVCVHSSNSKTHTHAHTFLGSVYMTASRNTCNKVYMLTSFRNYLDCLLFRRMSLFYSVYKTALNSLQLYRFQCISVNRSKHTLPYVANESEVHNDRD